MDLVQVFKEEFKQDENNSNRLKLFLSLMEKLQLNSLLKEGFKATSGLILLEGYYRFLPETQVRLRKILRDIRMTKWEQHYGTPTVPFLLSYANEITLTTQFFVHSSSKINVDNPYPWEAIEVQDSVIDQKNQVVVRSQIMAKVPMPDEEINGVFLKTYNPSGGFTTAPSDPISQEFLNNSKTIAKKGGNVLEVGAAFGAATLKALTQGVTVFCNDIEPANLAVVKARFSEHQNVAYECPTGDSKQLILLPGAFPEELSYLPENFFDAILICRVLHFFTGHKIEKSLTMLSKLLSPGGKLHIVCETPYLKNWQSFLPEYNQRVKESVEWPGEITHPADYESSGRASSLPSFVHWITKDILERSLLQAGLYIERSTYINRKGQFPDDLLLPEYGKESVGAIGVKN